MDIINPFYGIYSKQLLLDSELYSDNKKSLYIYSILTKAERYIGIIGTVPICFLEKNKVLLHEAIYPEKAALQARVFSKDKLQINPVLLVYKNSINNIEDELISITKQQRPIINTYINEQQHCLWSISEANVINQFITFYNNISCYYVADGHHRIAAIKKIFNDRFLAYFLNDNQIKLKSYNKVIYNFGHENVKELALQLSRDFLFVPKDNSADIQFTSTCAVYFNKQWHVIELKHPPKVRVDSSSFYFNHYFVEKIMYHYPAFFEQHTLPMLDTSIKNIVSIIDNGTYDAYMHFCPLSIEDVYSTVARQTTFPPHTTWFEPKIPDGLIKLKLNL